MKNKFYLKTTFLVILLSGIIAMLYFLNLNKEFDFKTKENIGTVNFINTSITLKLNDPVFDYANSNESNTLKDFFTLTPSSEFFATSIGDRIILTFKDSLQSETQYTLTASPDLKDVYERRLNKEKTFEFKTTSQRFTYLEKNHPQSKDKIVEYDLSSKSQKILFENENISKFGRDNEFLVVSVENKDKSNNIFSINLSEDIQIDLSLKSKKVRNLKFSPTKHEFIYTSYNLVFENGFAFQDPNSTTYFTKYNLDSGQAEVLNLPEAIFDLGEFIYTNDGEGLLFKSSVNSEYYLMNLNNTENLINIGKHLQTGGFSKDGDKILFTDYDPLSGFSSFPFTTIYSADRDNREITTGEFYYIDPIFSNDDEIFISEKYKELTGTRGLFKISKLDKNLQRFDVYRKDNMSIELPRISSDNKYISFETYTEAQLLDYSNFRAYEFQNKPAQGGLVIFDLNKNSIILELEGIEIVWHKF